MLAAFAGMGKGMGKAITRGEAFRPVTPQQKPKEALPSPPLAFRRSRRNRSLENEAPAKAVRPIPTAPPDVPMHPADWRQKSIRAAWAVLDWHTLKAFGEIEQVPEP